MYLHPCSPAHIFIVRRLIYVLKPAPAADIQDQIGLELRFARKNVRKKLLECRAARQGEPASPGIQTGFNNLEAASCELRD